jgi:hypothetical protein
MALFGQEHIPAMLDKTIELIRARSRTTRQLLSHQLTQARNRIGNCTEWRSRGSEF